MYWPETALFLWINADAHAPQAVVLLAHRVSDYLPAPAAAALALGASLAGALVGAFSARVVHTLWTLAGHVWRRGTAVTP